MGKNKIFTYVIIGVVGVGLLLTFITVLSGEGAEEITNSAETIETEIVSETQLNPDLSTESNDSAVSEINDEMIEDVGDEIVATGVFDAFVEYLAPKGYRDSINVNIELEEGVVVSIEVEYEADNQESAKYQNFFEQNYRSEVVGRKIDEIDLSRVGGASLTTEAFMEALDEISNQL